MKTPRLIFLILLLCMISGCSPSEYDIILRNVGTNTIKDAHVKYNDFQSIGGWLSPGIQKIHSRPGIPIPEFASVEWQTETGAKFQTNILVKQNLPRNFKGEIIF